MTLYIHLRDRLDLDAQEMRHRFIPADSIEIDELGSVGLQVFSAEAGI